MDVVIVESPAKAKTINKYLGSKYKVMASYGHVRDLPSKNGSVDPDADFAMLWAVDSKAKKRVDEIAKVVKDADKLILATDPDREGEAISWHVLEILKKKKLLKNKNVERVVFNAITKKSILEAMEKPRDIDQSLVDAYLARRALDYLVGFSLSPILWRKLPVARSAGRVQSVALRLVCERELAIEAFKSQEYWTIEAALTTGKNEKFTANLFSIEHKKLDKFAIPNGNDAKSITEQIAKSTFSVTDIESKPRKRNPYPPFTTSTLQQEASRKCGFASSRTMQVAQKLYEGVNLGGETVGLITYMRTDGVQIANEAIADCRNIILSEYGEAYLPSEARQYKTKAKNAQEAHEAIRPTDLSRLPKDVVKYLDKEQADLYELIWKRTIASQMESATLEATTLKIDATGADNKKYNFRASGSVIKFAGFLKLYQESSDDSDNKDEKKLPNVSVADRLGVEKIGPVQHFTEPPPRFTEASLIKKMEELGIGRPSTYTSTLSVLRDRGYVTLESKRLIPQDKGILVTSFLESFFKRYVEYDFTAELEEKLDLISNSEIAWKNVLKDFWVNFSNNISEASELRITEVLDHLNDALQTHIFPIEEEGVDPRKCKSCDDGRLSLKVGKYGAFIGCSNYPECGFTRHLTDDGESSNKPGDGEPIALGEDPETGLEVSLRNGRFGPYIQLGDTGDKKNKPKRASIPKSQDPEQINLDVALKLLSLPREVGKHPETGLPITAGFGRYGPYVLHDGTYGKLDSEEEVFDVGLNRAVTILAEKSSKKGGKTATQPGKALGEHPELGGEIKLMSGRYGPYVKHGKINATITKGLDPESLTLEQAVELIAAKMAKK